MSVLSVRRTIVTAALITMTAVIFYTLGEYSAERLLIRQHAEGDARIDALRAELHRTVATFERTPAAVGASGVLGEEPSPVNTRGRDLLVSEVKRQLQDEMGLLPVQLLRERRESFVELYAFDNAGKTNYGTAGYLGQRVLHHRQARRDGVARRPRRTATRPARSNPCAWRGEGSVSAASIVDVGDADVEVHSGDWAILKVNDPVDLPALKINPRFSYDFAEPIFRLGNDYSKGIILSTGYVGQRTANGLVTCLTDGHPGVSGGGVLDRNGDLVGIPIGRMQGDYRFSFILPVRDEMFRKIASLQADATHTDVPHTNCRSSTRRALDARL